MYSVRIFTLLLLSFSMPCFAEQAADGDKAKEIAEKCRSKYNESQLSQSMGTTYSISQKERDAEACKGKVGESFCITDKEKDFLKSCQENEAKREQDEIDKAIKLQEAVDAHKKKKKEEEDKDKDFIDL